MSQAQVCSHARISLKEQQLLGNTAKEKQNKQSVSDVRSCLQAFCARCRLTQSGTALIITAHQSQTSRCAGISGFVTG